ncbi:NAD(P)H:quinone oxidoreductase [Blastococcus xanthinilyticus]|uniref:NAD(P)H dehydrogenase (Quinone) n=1 Tax=Blastococcus xanthinilyticus TaxID=1564164 RepID=A0A5S5CSD0_9ACTN|nr:NAD(P)H:quinone oxidoreductase [Blastococcus xanthinilyticus]TYP84907.1 NAD(P)H dehydrogenase (quinone) [Blastococcus xanthinilyticus]
MAPRVAVIYYSATGHTHRLAEALAAGAAEAGAEVRLRRVRELAPQAAIAGNPAWQEHVAAASAVPEAALEDLEWAEGLAFGSPTRYGMIAAQLKQFLDMTGPLWQQGELADKVVTSFTGASTAHGGHETTLLSLSAVYAHWGAVIVPLGYTDPAVFATGNPYGSTWLSGRGEGPDPLTLRVAAHQGARLARWAGRAVLDPAPADARAGA